MSIIAILIIIGRIFFVGPIRDLISNILYQKNMTIPPESILILVSFIFFSFLLLFRNKVFCKNNLTVFILLIFIILNNLLIKQNSPFLGYMLFFLLSSIVFMHASLNQCEKKFIINKLFIIFVLYASINLLYWLFVLNRKFNPSTGVMFYRLGGSLAHAVHLGPILIIFLLLYISIFRKRNKLTTLIDIVLFSFFFFLIIISGSRLGLYLFFILIIIIFFDKNKSIGKLKNIAISFLTILILVYFISLKLNLRYVNIDLTKEERLNTWISSIKSFRNYNLFDNIIGRGWGNYYKYWEWLESGGATWGGQNLFFDRGRLLLVSPHNSFIWILAEGGLIPFILSFIIIIYPIFKIATLRYFNEKKYLLFLTAAVFLSYMFDDVLIVAPGTALFSLSISYLSIDEANRLSVDRRLKKQSACG